MALQENPWGSHSEKITDELRKRIDAKFNDPVKRAEEVWTVIQLAADELGLDTTQWDLLCFACQFLAKEAIGAFSSDDDFVAIVKTLNRWLYNAHYFYAEEIYERVDGDSGTGDELEGG